MEEPPAHAHPMWRRLTPLAVILLLALSAAGFVAASNLPGNEVARDAGGGTSGPPVAAPAEGAVTVGLAAVEDSTVRVTVDGVVEFNGVLQAGERRQWAGNERIQVWTDEGKTLQLSVNGYDLGAYSPAMGHPDWNRINYGFWPGWSP